MISANNNSGLVMKYVKFFTLMSILLLFHLLPSHRKFSKEEVINVNSIILDFKVNNDQENAWKWGSSVSIDNIGIFVIA
jgi:hypothetical protein